MDSCVCPTIDAAVHNCDKSTSSDSQQSVDLDGFWIPEVLRVPYRKWHAVAQTTPTSPISGFCSDSTASQGDTNEIQ